MSKGMPFGPEDLARAMVALEGRLEAQENFELFLEFCYCLLAMLTSPSRDRTRLLISRHTRVMRRYGDEKELVGRRFVELFKKAAASIVSSKEDFLGRVFLLLGFSHREFLSPEARAQVDSLISQENLDERVSSCDPLALGVPNCGSGALALEVARLVRQRGQDPEKCLLVIAADIDVRCFMMTFIQ